MKTTRRAVFGVGALVLLIGLVWMGQGSGYFPYPASSFMIDQSVWIYRGLAVALAGVVMVIVSRRI